MGGLIKRRGSVTNTETKTGLFIMNADVPLASMFGYATELRSMTQGKAEFTMEFHSYAPVPKMVQEELQKKYSDRAMAGGVDE